MNETQFLALSKHIGGLLLLTDLLYCAGQWDAADLISEAILKLQKAYRVHTLEINR